MSFLSTQVVECFSTICVFFSNVDVCRVSCVRSSDNLVSIEESERHCVAGGGGGLAVTQGRLQALTSSTSSLSSGGWENGEEEEEEEEGREGFSASVQITDSKNNKNVANK